MSTALALRLHHVLRWALLGKAHVLRRSVLLRGGADARVLRAGQAPQASEALAEGGGLVGAHEPFQLSGEAQLLLHLLAADEVMLNAGALDRKRALDKEARVPLALRGIVIGRVAAPKV